MKVIKRDCSEVDFDKCKIEQAILKAMKNGSGIIKEKIAEDIANEIYEENKENDEMSVFDIEDSVFNKLISKKQRLTARSYEGYRSIREFQRDIVNTTDKDILELLNREKNEVSYDNSNKNPRLNATQRDLVAGETSKDIAKRLLLPTKVVQAHENGVIHYSDLDYTMQTGMFNCCLINIQDMLDNGTAINGVDIESPKSFQVACNVVTQIMASIASNQYGGQSVNIKHLGKYLRKTYDKAYQKAFKKYGKKFYKEKYDYYVSEYGEDNRDLIREILTDISYNLSSEMANDKMIDELKSGVQTIQYQINTLMTTNGQSPFVTIFLHLDESDEYIEENAMIIEEILRQRLQGIKNKQGVYVTPAFPKLIYVLDENNCLKGGKYDYITKLAVKCSAKRLYPDYISAKKMRENYDGEVFSSMGCRSFLSNWKNEEGKYKWEGRFNQGVVTINLPQIGIIAEGNEDEFWELLEERLEICFEALMCRHKLLEGTVSDVSPIHWQDGGIARLKKGEKIDKLLHGGYSTISLGYIGLYEVTKAMKSVSHTDPIGTEFALKVMKKLKESCDKWKKETGISFGLYGSPAENMCYRFAKIDKEHFGEIKDITDKGYYTNSYHVDVREKIDMFNKFTFESQFQPISNGGCISYCEIPYIMDNLEALEEAVKFIYDNIQYAEFNTKSDYCHKCGYQGEILLDKNYEWYCPNCNNRDENKMYVTRRTCGYVGTNFWNKGKTIEIGSRVLHIGD